MATAELRCPECGSDRIVEWSRAVEVQRINSVDVFSDGKPGVWDYGKSLHYEVEETSYSCYECEGPQGKPLDFFVVIEK